MVRPTLKKQIPNLQEAIKETAWKQAAEYGAAALSLRAIARELKITAPAIYNYFPSRDELVTALIVDAYNSLADAQEASLVNIAVDKYSARLSALGLAYREWAVTYPQRYQLIFGTPIPNYRAPENITVPAAARGLIPLTRVVQEIASSGNLRAERLAKMTPKLKSMVMIELSNHLPPTFDEPSEFFRREINNFLIQYL
jgi:AcrR family transcriptional regulator